MNRSLIIAILIIDTLPLYAQGQHPNAAELAQKVVSIPDEMRQEHRRRVLGD